MRRVDPINRARRPHRLPQLPVFIATEPYYVTVLGNQYKVGIYSTNKTFNLVTGHLVNPVTGSSDCQTIQSWDVATTAAKTLATPSITNAGLPGHVENLADGRLKTAVLVGDGLTAGKCRTSVTGFAPPTRRVLFFDMIVQFGDPSVGLPWEFPASGVNTTLFFQMKDSSVGTVNPVLSCHIDTDAYDATKLQMKFALRAGSMGVAVTLAIAHGLKAHTRHRVIIETVLDEREINNGGTGYWKVWLNGKLWIDYRGPTLLASAVDPPFWYLTVYCFNYAPATPPGSAWNMPIFWERGKMLIGD